VVLDREASEPWVAAAVRIQWQSAEERSRVRWSLDRVHGAGAYAAACAVPLCKNAETAEGQRFRQKEEGRGHWPRPHWGNPSLGSPFPAYGQPTT
jgi:hypothetical protein